MSVLRIKSRSREKKCISRLTIVCRDVCVGDTFDRSFVSNLKHLKKIVCEV